MTYDVVGLLGRGGSAVVELAVDAHGRRVATKRVVLAGSAAQIHAARVRLRREAQILSSLAHPGIVPVLDIVDDGTDVVLVMPAMAENLEDRVRRLGPRPAGEVVAIGRVLLEALAAAHRHGVVHRDIKPANVLFDGRGAPALADFGAAVTAEMTAGLTGSGAVLGTPMWMAPEQARGAPAGPPGDVFSLAATLSFAASGRGPYPPGPPLAVLGHAAAGRILPLPGEVPANLRSALARMLDPDPAGRPSAAAVLGGVGHTLTAPAPAAPHPAGSPHPGGPPHPAGSPHPGGPPRPAGSPHPGGPPGPIRSIGRRLAPLAARAAGDPRPEPRRRRRWPLIAATAATAVVAAVVALALTGPAPDPAPLASAPSPTACTPEPYQPCGSAGPAPHTDGYACLPGWYDLDGSAADGCESRSDYTPGTVLTDRAPVRANLVPPYTTDSFSTRVSGHALDLCWGTLHVTLTAPAGTAERVQVLKGSTVVGSALSADGSPATASVSKPTCFGSDSEDLTVTVTEVAATGASANSDFTLTRDAGW